MGLVREHGTLNGIDFLQVLDDDAPAGSPRQRTLLIYCVKAINLGTNNVRIQGGVRISPVGIDWAVPASKHTDPSAPFSSVERAYLAALALPEDLSKILVARTDAYGDYSQYRLSLTESGSSFVPPQDFDPLLSQVDLHFKVECPSPFDCREQKVCPEKQYHEPMINYLAKDYDSFRQLMLDRISVIMPDWQERSPADVQVMLVEMLAYVGDQLSQYQDAVATEAYLGTTRRRISMRRHAKLLDYRMHDGCNARAWVCFSMDKDGPNSAHLPKGTVLLTTPHSVEPTLNPAKIEKALREEPTVFETLHALEVHKSHSSISFYTWADSECCLPRGTTSATFVSPPGAPLQLETGRVLLFEEIRSPTTGNQADADPSHRHAVQISKITPTTDPLTGEDVVDVEWHVDDGLPFPLCISEKIDDEQGDSSLHEISVARGNVALVDHGMTIRDEPLDPEDVPERIGYREWLPDEMLSIPAYEGPGFTNRSPYRPKLRQGPLTHQGRLDDTSATSAMDWKVADATPAVMQVTDSSGTSWIVQEDGLLDSNAFDNHFVIETERGGIGHLRFGDNVHGRHPPKETFKASYRIGNGKAGNVGADTIRRVVTTATGIDRVWNPLPAQGGIEPEAMEEVRRYAPVAFRVQERAVTEEDYATVMGRNRQIQQGAATFRWTGSWYTVFNTVDRKGGLPVDEDFRDELLSFLQGYKIADVDLEVNGPTFVPLDLVVHVCVSTDYFRGHIHEELHDVFSNRDLPNGRQGFFHPDRFTFGQPVYLSHLYETAMEVPGIHSVNITRFKRWGKQANEEIEKGVLELGRLEVARLDNDLNFQENGKIEFEIMGGQ